MFRLRPAFAIVLAAAVAVAHADPALLDQYGAPFDATALEDGTVVAIVITAKRLPAVPA